MLLDRGVEDRAVVFVGGRPQALIFDRPEAPGEPDRSWLRGEPAVARVAKIDRGLGMAFLEIAGSPGLTTPAAGLREGELIAGRVSTPARAGKHAVFARSAEFPTETLTGPHRGERPTVAERARMAAGDRAPECGSEARSACNAAEAEALQIEHALPGGARLFIEPTRALIAVDVDVGASAAGGDVRRRQRQAGLAALAALPRLLRLKGLGGLIVIDLPGKGHDGAALAAAATAALTPVFGADAAVGPLSRFGILQLQASWLDTPVAERLLDSRGEPTPVTLAFRLLREIEREAGPGGRVAVRCAPEVYAAAAPYAAQLKGVIGDRFTLAPDPSVLSDAPVVSPL